MVTLTIYYLSLGIASSGRERGEKERGREGERKRETPGFEPVASNSPHLRRQKAVSN
jgi:hypothetical protein